MDTHDKLGLRLGLILTKLNAGERINVDALSVEFNVSRRTIQRDLNQRLAYLPLEQQGSDYWLSAASLGKRSNRDIRHFAAVLSIEGMFPYLDDRLLHTLLDSNQQAPFLIKGSSYEDSSVFVKEFRLLERCIRNQQVIEFSYKADRYQPVYPYRLVNYRGLWYLAAVHDGKLKSFVASNIRDIHHAYETFPPDNSIQREINENATIWYGASVIEVVISVSATVTEYFKRRMLLPEQKILHELEGGDLLVSTRVQHPTQILPLIKYWLPHVDVVSPASIKKQVLADLRTALDRMTPT